MSKDSHVGDSIIRRFFYALRDTLKTIMSIKSTIAAVAASPFLFAGAAFAGPYVNVEANGSYPAGEYAGGNLEAQVGYEGTTEGGLSYYVSAGPTVPHTDSPAAGADKFGDVELAGYLGSSKALTESVRDLEAPMYPASSTSPNLSSPAAGESV